MGYKKCSVNACSSSTADRNPSFSFVDFPSDVDRCRDWCSTLEIPYNPEFLRKNSHFVCHLHFLPTSFVTIIQRKLKEGCSPVVRNRQPLATIEHDQDDMEVDLENEVSDISPISQSPKQIKNLEALNNKYKKNIKALLKKLLLLEQKVPKLDKDIIESAFPHAKSVAQFFIMQKERFANPKHSNWSELERTFSLSMYYAVGKKGYSWFQDMGFVIPALSTLRSWVCRIRMSPGRCEDAIRSLAKQVEGMSDLERDCVVSMDETSVKALVEYNRHWDILEGIETFAGSTMQMRRADHACVFMARGVLASWKSALSFQFSSGSMPSVQLKEILLQTLSELQRIGLRVRAVVNDQGFTNVGLFSLLRVTKEEPYFIHDGAKIYALYDTPHLMKGIRNNLFNHGYIIPVTAEEHPANWELTGRYTYQMYEVKPKQFQEAYEKDMLGSTRTMPRISDKHVDLNHWSKMKVKLATQTFSRSVASAIRLMVEKKELGSEYLGLAYLAEEFNDIFDLLNISEETCCNPLKSGKKIFENKDRLLHYASWIGDIKVLDKVNVPSLKNFQQTLIGMHMLIGDLQSDGHTFVKTRKIQSDFLEHFFAFIKYHKGPGKNLTCVQFRQCFRYLFISNLIRSPSGANCEEFEGQETLQHNMYKLQYLLTKTDKTPLNVQHDRELALTYVVDSEDDEFESGSEDSNDEARISYLENRFFEGVDATESNQVTDNAAIYLGTSAVKQCIKRTKCQDCRTELLEFATDRQENLLNDNETMIFLKAMNKDVFNNVKEMGYGHLLQTRHHMPFLNLGRKFGDVTKTSQNLYGTTVIQNIYRELKKDLEIRLFVTDEILNENCQKHREEIIKYVLRSKLYSLLRELNDYGNKNPSIASLI